MSPLVVGLRALLDAYIAMIPKADGGLHLLKVNGPSACSRLCTGCGLPFGLDICGSGFRVGYLSLFTAEEMVYPRLRRGSLLR